MIHRITSACCLSHCVAWTVFPLVPRYKTAANAGVIRYQPMSTEQIQSDIAEFGWHFIHVFDPDEDLQDFSYSVGFEQTFKHPEVMIFGLPRESSHAIISEIAEDIKNGITFKTDERLKNVIGGDFEVMFKPVAQAGFDSHLGAAQGFYNVPFRALVMFWPDKDNRLPFDAGCENTVQNEALTIV